MEASPLLLVLLVSLAHAHPTSFHCSRYCKENWSKYGYESGSTYVYNYEGLVRTLVNATSSNGVNSESRLVFKSKVRISSLSTCDFVLYLSDTNVDEIYINKNTVVSHIPEKSSDFSAALTKHPLYFSFQDGRIEHVCAEDDDHEILQVKKGILSAFQNSMPNLDGDVVVYETDVSGNCETHYQVEDSTPGLTVRKTKNLEACAHRKSQHVSWFSEPYSRTTKRSPTLLKSKQNCKQIYSDDLVLQSSHCTEEHLFQPLSNGENGIVAYLFQNLEFIARIPSIPIFDAPKNIHYENLYSNLKSDDDSEISDVVSIQNLLKNIEKRTTDGVEPDVPKLFSQLVHELQRLDYNAMVALFYSIKSSPKQKKFILDAMPLVTSVDVIQTMKMLYHQEEVSENQMDSWLNSLVFVTNISLPTIEAITPLMKIQRPIKKKAVLIGSSLIYMYCKDDSYCLNKPAIQSAVKVIEGPIVSNCIPTSPNRYNEILLALKGIGNIGLTISLERLKNCYSNPDSPMEIRLAAIAAHRRVDCSKNENLEQFEDYFADIRQNTEIRIASYLASMQCASYATFARVKDVLRTEETNQVGSFVWTHLTNLQESSSRWKHSLRSLVENEFLRNKFSTDIRKYSRNYEVSTFFDSLNAGVTMESNVIFTSESYLPKSAMLNFTVDLFEEAVNIFEIGARVEGFEQIVENLFGPEGYFPEESIRNVLENIPAKEKTPQDKIQELRDSFTSQTTFKQPSGLLYAKIFGHEISYMEITELQRFIDGRGALDAIMKMFQKDIDYTKSFVFLDSSYKVPTVLGFPLTLVVNGTATMGLTVKGKVDFKELWAHKLSVEGKIYPSAAVEVIGIMTVDSFTSKIGLKSVNTINSNTYLNGHAFINKGKLVDLKLNVPKQQMNIINVETQIFNIQSDRSYPMDDVTDNVENWEGCTQKLFNTITGFEMCYNMRYPNASLSPHAPYFPLTGKFKLSVDIKKTDVFDSYELKFKTHTLINNFRPVYSMSFYFDTPNSRIDRRMQTFYTLDLEKLSFNASLFSPFANIEVNSRIGDDFDNLGFLLQTKLNHNDIIYANMTLKSTKIDDTWKYEPLARLNYKNRQIAALSGSVVYLQGKKYNADLKIEGLLDDPVTVSGDLHLRSKKLKLAASIKSKMINGNTQAIIIKKPESISITSKTTYDYGNRKDLVLDLDLKQHTIMTGSMSEELLYLNVNSTYNPFYNTLLSANIRRDKLYFEATGLATLFARTWKTHQLFRFSRSETKELALQCSLSCEQKNIDYNINLHHIQSNDIFKVHGLFQLNKLQRLEALINYNKTLEKHRIFNFLIYYPNHEFSINGTFKQENEKHFNVFLESFYEINAEKRCMLVLSGQYINSTNGLSQNHTVTGSVEVPDSNGQLFTPWLIFSTLQISPDLFLVTAHLRTTEDLFVSHFTWAHHSASGLLQINDKPLLVLNGLHTEDEFSLTLGLNIYQHFEFSTKLQKPFQKFEIELYWDKDVDVNQKFALMVSHKPKKGLYLLDIEYPNQRVAASFVLLPEQVTLNVTWGVQTSQRIYLKAGNKVYDIGGIWFAQLETPFAYIENQEIKLSYYILPDHAELKTDVLWRDQQINFVMSGMKSIHHISGYVDLNTTLPEISKISIMVSHVNNHTNGTLKIKNDAAFIFNQHQITGQCLWESRGTNVSSNFEIISPSGMISPIVGSFLLNNSRSSNRLNSFVEWRNERISVDYKLENSQSYLEIKTPFKGLEVVEMDYTLVGEADKLMLEVKVNILTQFNYALVSWNNEGDASIVKMEIISPILGAHKIIFKHSTIFGQLEEYLRITEGKRDILAVTLQGKLVPILLMDVSASVNFLEHQAAIAIKNNPNPIISSFKANWDETFVRSVLTVVFEDSEITDLRWDASSSFVTDPITFRYSHQDSYILVANLPKGYKLRNVLTVDNSYKSVKNVLNVNTPVRSGSLEYSHVLSSKNCKFDQQIVIELDGKKSHLDVNYSVNEDIDFIDAATVKFISPWQSPLTIQFTMLQDQNIWKPSLQFYHNSKNVIDVKATAKVENLRSEVDASFNFPYVDSFSIHTKYDFTADSKTIDITLNTQKEVLGVSSEFALETNHGFLSINAGDKSGLEKKLLTSFMSYDFNNVSDDVYVNVLLPREDLKMEFNGTSRVKSDSVAADVLFLSTIPTWGKLHVDLELGLNHDKNHVIIGINDKVLALEHTSENLNDERTYLNRVVLKSDFSNIPDCSVEGRYKDAGNFQEGVLIMSSSEHNITLKGNYKLESQNDRSIQMMSLDGFLKIDYHRTLDGRQVGLFNVHVKPKGSIEIKENSGGVSVAFNSNIPNFQALNVEASYVVERSGYKIKTSTTYNKDYYNMEHSFQTSLNKIEILASLNTPPHLYGSTLGKVVAQQTHGLFECNALVEKNSQMYKVSVATKHIPFWDSITNIELVLPSGIYTGGINVNASLAEPQIRIFALIDKDLNFANLTFKHGDILSGELVMLMELPTFKISPWKLNANYDFFSLKNPLIIDLHNDKESGIEIFLDTRKLLFTLHTSSVKDYFVISGKHQLDDLQDLSMSYSFYFNDEKVKIDLSHVDGESRLISFLAFTTIKGWHETSFRAELSRAKLSIFTTFQNQAFSIQANQNALFHNEELLAVEVNKMPVLLIWSGIEESYLTSLSPWGNYKFRVVYAENPKLYSLYILQNENELVSVSIDDIHTVDVFDFTARVSTELVPGCSNISLYFYTDYKIPNEFKLHLTKGAEQIISLHYDFKIKKEDYAVVLNFNSNWKALQRFDVVFNLNSGFLVELEVLKKQYHVEKLYKFKADLPRVTHEYVFEIVFPWQNQNFSLVFNLHPPEINFHLQTPINNWNEVVLKANFAQNYNKNGSLHLKLNKAFAFIDWSYGYEEIYSPFFNIQIVNSALNNPENIGTISVQGKYGREVLLSCDIDEFENQLHSSFALKPSGLFFDTEANLALLFVEDTLFHLKIIPFSLSTSLRVNSKNAFTLNMSGETNRSREHYALLLGFYDNICYCDCTLTVDGGLKSSLNISMPGYTLTADLEGMLKDFLLGGNATATVIKGWDPNDLTTDIYEVSWHIKHLRKEKSASLSLKQGDLLSSLSLIYFSTNERLQSQITVSLNNRTIDAKFQGIFNNEVACATFNFVSPLKAVKELAFETILSRKNGSFSFYNFLSWPRDQNITFNVKATDNTVEMLFDCPFTEPLRGNLMYALNPDEIKFNLLCSLGESKTGLKGTVVPKSYLTVSFTSPFAGYTSLNLTCSLDLQTKIAKIHFEKETLITNLIGVMKNSDSQIYEINMRVAQSNVQPNDFAKMLLKIDIENMQGNVDIFWYDDHFRIGVNYNPKNLLLEVKSPYKAAKEVRLQGKYSNDVKSRSFKASGTWNTFNVDFQGLVFNNDKNFTLFSEFNAGKKYQGHVHFYNGKVANKNSIKLLTYYPHKNSRILFDFWSEKLKNESRGHVLILTPFESISRISAETTARKDSVQAQLAADLVGKTISSNLTSAFRNYLLFDTIFTLTVPHVETSWEVETKLDLYRKGLLKVYYTNKDRWENASLSYSITNSKFESRCSSLSKNRNINHSFDLHFETKDRQKEYGVVLDNYNIFYRYIFSFRGDTVQIQANLPYDIPVKADIILNSLESKAHAKCYLNGFNIDFDVQFSSFLINATTILKTDEYFMAKMTTEFGMTNKFFIKNNILDGRGFWLNSSLDFIDNRKEFKLETFIGHTLHRPFTFNIHFRKSLEKILIEFMDIFKFDVLNTQPSKKVFLSVGYKKKHNLHLDLNSKNLTFNINSSLVNSHDLKLICRWIYTSKNKSLDVSYFQSGIIRISANLDFHYTEDPLNGTRYVLTITARDLNKALGNFKGTFLIANVTEGIADLIIFEQKSHVHFSLNPSDPYKIGFTIESPFLPYEGVTVKTAASVISKSFFVFIGSGSYHIVEKNVIQREPYEVYVFLEAKREKNRIFLNYEAPNFEWLQLVNLEAYLDVGKKTVRFSENVEIKSSITNYILLNSKLDVLSSRVSGNVSYVLPFMKFQTFHGEFSLPFKIGNNINFKFLIELPSTVYSTYFYYQNHEDEFVMLGGYQFAEMNFNIFVNLTKSKYPSFFAEINLPNGSYKHFALSLTDPTKFALGEEVNCYLDAFNKRFDLNSTIVYDRDHIRFKTVLTTPIESYEKLSLDLEYKNDHQKIFKALVFHPLLERECGFDFQLDYRGIKQLHLLGLVSIPVQIKGFNYGEFSIDYDLNGNNKPCLIKSFSKINNFNASFALETALTSELLLFDLNTTIGKNKFYTLVKSSGDIHEDFDFIFELATPLNLINNMKLFWVSSRDLNRGIQTGLIYNSRTFAKIDFTIKDKEVYFEFDNIWRAFLLQYLYSYDDYLHTYLKVSWDLNLPKASSLGGHIMIGQNFSVGVILPTRVMSVDGNYFIRDHYKHYFGRIMWYEGREIAAKISFLNDTNDSQVYLRSAAIITLPFRTFEIVDEVDANFKQSPIVKSKFTFKWDRDNTSKVSFQNEVRAGKVESRLFLPILQHEIVFMVDVTSLTKIPSFMKAQLEYSDDINKRLEFEMYYDKAFTDVFQTERIFILKHPASKIDYSLHFSTTRTPEYTVGNITLHYMNYFLEKREQIRSSLKIGHERFEVSAEIETSKNYLNIAGVSKTGPTYQGFVATVQVNKKDPLVLEGTYNFKPTGSSISVTSRYGTSRVYDFYAGLPSKREIAIKLLHQLYNIETTDALFTVKLNSSQILWMKLNWQKRLLPEFKNAVLEEYNDVRYIIEGTGQELIEVLDDDFGQALISDILQVQNNLSLYSNAQFKRLHEDYRNFVNDVKEGYQSNAFYVKNIEEKLKYVFPDIDILKTLLDPVWDFYEMLYNELFLTIDDFTTSLRDISSVIQLEVEQSLKGVKDVKKLKARAKTLLKDGINEVRESLKQVDVLVGVLLENIDEYIQNAKQECEAFFEPYLKLSDDFVIYVEQRLAILQLLVLDMLDTIQHYILNLRESREILKMYALYINWLEEFHLTDVLEPVGDIIEAILETLITDIKKVVDDYRIYVDAISEAVFGNYQELNNIPPLAEIREFLNKIYQRTLWIWNYHNLSEAIRGCIHKVLSDFDDYLASLIKMDNESNDFENVLGQSDYIFRPDLGLIEITQPLPVEWEAFDEMPYFEQHPLYDKIKRRVKNLIQLERHHFNDIINIIQRYTGESSDNLLMPSTNNIAMVVGKSHYITFDEKYYSFSGECSYLLASDFVTNTFSIVINYSLDKSLSKKKSISILVDDNTVEIYPDFNVTLNNVSVDFPLVLGSLTVTRENYEIFAENCKGLKVKCNLYYDYCLVELSGWLFGKTGGLLGTLDNEKATDMSLPGGDRTSDVLKFAESWQVGSAKCRNVNYANDTTKANISPLSTTLFETLCQIFFINVNSPFGHCFNLVDPKPFYDICVTDMKNMVNPTMCPSAAAYRAQCEEWNVRIDMPEICVHCNQEIDANEEIFDGDNPKSIDVVVIKEYACFREDQDFSSLPLQINTALEVKGFNGNLFAVVGYGNIGKPFVQTSKTHIWTTAEKTVMNVKLNGTANPTNKVSGIDAITFASNLEFRPGVSKLFILIQCDFYTEVESLNNLHNMFGEKDIILHVLKVKPFNNGEQLLELDSQGHVLYLQQGFDVHDSNIQSMNTTVTEIIPSQITDVYSLLALSTNGTVLNIDNRINPEKDLISASWAEIISHTARRSPCQRCKCITSRDGTGKVECTRCMSPIVKRLLNEYESNIMEFHTDPGSDEFV